MLKALRNSLLAVALVGIGVANAATDWTKAYPDEVTQANKEMSKTVKPLATLALPDEQFSAQMELWDELNPETPQSPMELAAQWTRFLDYALKNQPYYAHVVRDNYIDFAGCIFGNPLAPRAITVFSRGGIGDEVAPALFLYSKTGKPVGLGGGQASQRLEDTLELWKTEKSTLKYTTDKSYTPYHPLRVAKDIFGTRTASCASRAVAAASDFEKAKRFYQDPIVKAKHRQFEPYLMAGSKWSPEQLGAVHQNCNPKADYTAAIIMKAGLQ